MIDKPTPTIDVAYLEHEAETLHTSIDVALEKAIDVLQSACDRGAEDEIERAAFLVAEIRRAQQITRTATGRTRT